MLGASLPVPHHHDVVHVALAVARARCRSHGGGCRHVFATSAPRTTRRDANGTHERRRRGNPRPAHPGCDRTPAPCALSKNTRRDIIWQPASPCVINVVDLVPGQRATRAPSKTIAVDVRGNRNAGRDRTDKARQLHHGVRAILLPPSDCFLEAARICPFLLPWRRRRRSTLAGRVSFCPGRTGAARGAGHMLCPRGTRARGCRKELRIEPDTISQILSTRARSGESVTIFAAERSMLATAQNYRIVMIASFRFPAIVRTAVVTGTRLRGAAESFCGHNGR